MDSWQFWLELILRSSVLLLSAEVLRCALASHSSALRHKLLFAAFAFLALMPVLAVFLPSIPIALWTHVHPSLATVTVHQLVATPINGTAQHHVNWLVMVWLLGVFAACLPLVVGSFSVAKVVRRAKPFRNAAGISAAPVLMSDEISAPVTCGVWRPCILLPAAASAWSSSRLHAVLAHELAHVRRRDVLAQLAAHLVSALWWFQPLVWVLRRRLRAESEMACDAEALKSGLRPSCYAAELLAVARSINPAGPALSSCGINMAQGSPLERRVEVILNSRAVASSLTKRLALAAILPVIAVAATAITPGSDESFSEQGGSTMKRTLMSGLLTSIGLSAATVTGSVHDLSGSAIANATITVVNPDTGSQQVASTDAQGKFSLSGASAGQYILKVEKPGFAPLLREFDLKADTNMDRQIVMAAEGTQSGTEDEVTQAEGATKPVSVGGAVAESNLINKVQPIYPPAAKAAGTQGTVQIKATISKDGIPVDLEVVSTPSSDLAESALQAVRQWRYRPTLLNGEPVEVTTTVIVNYTLSS